MRAWVALAAGVLVLPNTATAAAAKGPAERDVLPCPGRLSPVCWLLFLVAIIPLALARQTIVTLDRAAPAWCGALGVEPCPYDPAFIPVERSYTWDLVETARWVCGLGGSDACYGEPRAVLDALDALLFNATLPAAPLPG